jgi:steroid delta-isomerase-like uncharacterized protein
MATTETENKELVHTLTNEAMSEHNMDIADELVSEDYVAHNSMVPEPYYGPEGFKETMSKFLTAFPDMDYTVDAVIAEDDKVVTRYRGTATHEGGLMGIPPTGKEIELKGTIIWRIEDGQIAEAWGEWDFMNLLKQLGFIVLPGPRLMGRMVIGKVKPLLSGG